MVLARPEGDTTMSAFIVDKQHIDNIVATAMAYRMRQAAHPTQLGRMLWVENTKSVAYRYSDHPDFPEFSDVAEAETYGFNAYSARSLTAVEVLKAINCLEYQSCEHPGWQTSTARVFLDEMRSEAINHLPGYDAAPWEWKREKTPA